MIQNIETEQTEYLASRPESKLRDLGQFFTGAAVADYMASMVHGFPDVDVVRFLDAGAGTGILTGSAAMRLLELGHKRVHAVLYELDDAVLSHLERNMRRLVRQFKKEQGEFTFDIRSEDFVIARPDWFDEPFHASSLNPPYFKYRSKGAKYSGATADLFEGNPNIYASFMAVVCACLSENGEMVAIVPRSFTNGLYFKGFRRYLSAMVSLEHMHIFKSRNRVFKNQDVLQENIICRFVRRRQIKRIEIRSSVGSADLEKSETNTYPVSLIIDRTNEHHIIRIPETKEDGRVLKSVEAWPTSFTENGYYISTGPVVEHRTRRFITPKELKGSVPLLRMHNVKAFRTEWSGEHRKDVRFVCLDGYEKHITKNRVYVILKRFTSKDERRRLVAGVHDPKCIGGELIGIENHLNYIGVDGEEMQLLEAYGLAGLLNSTFMDDYFRCVSGNTQVNATEIRLLKLPRREVIVEIGKEIRKVKHLNQGTVDSIVERRLEEMRAEE